MKHLNSSKTAKQVLDLSGIKKVILYTWLFVFPLFFLPLTQDLFSINKFFLTSAVALVLLLLSTLELVANKTLSWTKTTIETPLLLLILASALSILISSPNRIQALLSTRFSPIMLVSFGIILYYLVKHRVSAKKILLIDGLILSLVAIVMFFNPFAKAKLPNSLFFLKNPYFNPIGSYLDLLIFLGFVFVWNLLEYAGNKQKRNILSLAASLFLLLGFSVALYNIIKPQEINGQKFQLFLPPLRLSWYAAVEILKTPLKAVFGVGVDNFASIFTKVKDVQYNQSKLWQISFFNFSRTGLLHITSVAGLLGLLSFVLFFTKLLNEAGKKNRTLFYLGLVLSLVFLTLPISIIVWFLTFVLAAQILGESESTTTTFNLSNITPAYVGIPVASLLFVGASAYFLGKFYLAEVYFKKALDGFVQNNMQTVYENHRKAIQLNPKIERFRNSFSQVNLLFANNLTQQILKEQKKENPDQEKINNLRQSVIQAIQAAINEAKAVVALNPQKAAGWANLATIYRNILNLVQNADVWTISAYQRAIVLDPQNPMYRLNLGGVYYSLQKYDDALRLFEQAVGLKPDWANAHYNLAWAAYNKGDYQRAVIEMQNVLNLLDPKKAKADYERAKKELEEFKKKLPETKEATESATPTPTPSQLTLPTPAPTLEPKINLPKEASPEAK